MPKGVHINKQRAVRLSDQTWAMLAAISDHYGLGGRADAIRMAARRTADALGIDPQAWRKVNTDEKSEESGDRT
jgi:hypothetical protein